MAKMKDLLHEWIVVCDGGRAFILVNHGERKFPNLKVERAYEHEGARTSDLGRDAPPRVHQFGTPARSAIEATDLHELGEKKFLHSLAQTLEEAFNKGEARSFVLVAPPRALGILRDALPERLRAVISAEHPKDIVKLPVIDIERHLFPGAGR